MITRYPVVSAAATFTAAVGRRRNAVAQRTWDIDEQR